MSFPLHLWRCCSRPPPPPCFIVSTVQPFIHTNVFLLHFEQRMRRQHPQGLSWSLVKLITQFFGLYITINLWFIQLENMQRTCKLHPESSQAWESNSCLNIHRSFFCSVRSAYLPNSAWRHVLRPLFPLCYRYSGSSFTSHPLCSLPVYSCVLFHPYEVLQPHSLTMWSCDALNTPKVRTEKAAASTASFYICVHHPQRKKKSQVESNLLQRTQLNWLPHTCSQTCLFVFSQKIKMLFYLCVCLGPIFLFLLLKRRKNPFNVELNDTQLLDEAADQTQKTNEGEVLTYQSKISQ